MVKTEKNLNSVLSPPGCQEPFRQDRITSRGGGVAVYVLDGLAASAINSITSPLFQCLVLSIVLSQQKRLTLIICYLENVQLPLCFSSERLLSFIPGTAILWNNLPSSITSLFSLKFFFHSLQVHFQADRFSLDLSKVH